MSKTARITYQISVGGVSDVSEVSVEGETLIDYGATTINDGTTDLPLDIKLDVSEVAAFYVKSSVDMTIETNATNAAGGNTLSLLAGEAYVWRTGDLNTFKLTQDVTQVYVTNASGTNGTLKIVALSTPA